MEVRVADHSTEQRRARAGAEAVVLQVEGVQPRWAEGVAERDAARVADVVATKQQCLAVRVRARVRVRVGVRVRVSARV